MLWEVPSPNSYGTSPQNLSEEADKAKTDVCGEVDTAGDREIRFGIEEFLSPRGDDEGGSGSTAVS